MNFIGIIKKEMYEAMKSGQKERAAILRVLLAKLKDKQINQRKELSEQDGLAVIKTLVKQRKESIEMYEKAGRTDLAENEKSELTLLESYLPEMMTDEEIRELVLSVIAEIGVSDIGDIGKVMPVVMQRGGGVIDGKKANLILMELLT